MGGVKRKASRPAPYEVPSKLRRNETADEVANKLSLLKTVSKSPMVPLKFPSLRRKRSSTKIQTQDTSPALPTRSTLKRKRTPEPAEDLPVDTTSGQPLTGSPKLKRKRTTKDINIDSTTGLPLPKWPALIRKRTTKTMVDDLKKETVTSPPPGIRRAPTLQVPEKDSSSPEIKTTRSLPKKRSSSVKSVSKRSKSESIGKK